MINERMNVIIAIKSKDTRRTTRPPTTMPGCSARPAGARGIHVAHFVIDGVLRRSGRSETACSADSELDPDSIAQTYIAILDQPHLRPRPPFPGDGNRSQRLSLRQPGALPAGSARRFAVPLRDGAAVLGDIEVAGNGGGSGVVDAHGDDCMLECQRCRAQRQEVLVARTGGVLGTGNLRTQLSSGELADCTPRAEED